MHEMGITQGILAASVDAVKGEGGTRINEIRISVGEMTEVVEDALQFAFEALRAEPDYAMAADAVLLVTHVPASSACPACDGEVFEHGRFDGQCPKCGNPFVEPRSGHELRIDSIDFD